MEFDFSDDLKEAEAVVEVDDENDRHYFENLPLEAEEEGGNGKGLNYSKQVDEYLQLLQETCGALSQVDGGYRSKLAAYIKKRKEESALYEEVAAIPFGSLDCDLAEVHGMTNERRWRATSSVQGPAWKRYLERNPPTKIRGLTEREQAIVNKNMRDRALWQKIMSALPSLVVFTLWLAVLL